MKMQIKALKYQTSGSFLKLRYATISSAQCWCCKIMTDRAFQYTLQWFLKSTHCYRWIFWGGTQGIKGNLPSDLWGCLHAKEAVSVTVFQASANWQQVNHLVETLIKCISSIMQWKVINFCRKCEKYFATFSLQFYIECISVVLHKTDFTSARLAVVKSRCQHAFILLLVFLHKMPSQPPLSYNLWLISQFTLSFSKVTCIIVPLYSGSFP